MRLSEAQWKATAVYHRTCLDDDRVNRCARNYVTFGARPNVGVLLLLPKQLRIGDRFTDADGVWWEITTHPQARRGGKNFEARNLSIGMRQSVIEFSE